MVESESSEGRRMPHVPGVLVCLTSSYGASLWVSSVVRMAFGYT